MRESALVQIALYDKENCLKKKSAFKWWIPYVLKKADRIIGKDKTVEIYGIEMYLRELDSI